MPSRARDSVSHDPSHKPRVYTIGDSNSCGAWIPHPRKVSSTVLPHCRAPFGGRNDRLFFLMLKSANAGILNELTSAASRDLCPPQRYDEQATGESNERSGDHIADEVKIR